MSKRSFVHQYFQTVAEGNKVRCIECAITVITLTMMTESTSVTRNHLAFKHPQHLYEKVLEDETSAKKSKAELVNISSYIRDIKMRLNGCCSFCHCNTPFTRYSRLSNRFYNRFDNRLYHVNKHPTGCQTGCQTFDNRFDNRVERTATVPSTGC